MDGRIDGSLCSSHRLCCVRQSREHHAKQCGRLYHREIAALAAREASSTYQNLKEAGVVADTLADSIAVAVVDSVAYAAYDSLFASLRTIFGPEATAAFDQYMDAKQAFYTVGTPVDETALSGAFEIGKYLFNAAGVMHRLTAAEIAIWGNEYYPAWDRFNAAGKEITKQAAAAAHNANCAFYNDAILSLDAPDASAGYRAAILAFSGAYLEMCASMPPSQFSASRTASWPLRSGGSL